jgi:hypothetical protein
MKYFFILTLLMVTAQPAQAQIIVPSTHNISGTDNYIEITKPSGTTGDVLILDSNGKLGISNTTPIVPLDIGGELRLGDNDISCTASLDGTLRYREKNLEICFDSAWSLVDLTCTGTPQSFDVASPSSAVSASTLTTSAVAEAVIDTTRCDLDVSISGDGSPQYRTCRDANCTDVREDWTNTTEQVRANEEYVQVRLTSSATGGDVYTATLTVGGASDTFTVVTERDFKYVFVTGTGRTTAEMGGVAGADEICQADAIEAGLSGTYKAWISTDGSDDPDARFTKATVPYKLVNGTTVANNWTDLTDGTIAAAINRTALNVLNNNYTVFTHTDEAGIAVGGGNASFDCTGFAANTPYEQTQTGYSGATNADWSWKNWSNCHSSYALYCFEQ